MVKCWWCTINIQPECDFHAPFCASRRVYGHFCSPSCALAYVLHDTQVVKKNDAVTMLMHMYEKTCGGIPILPSPPKEMMVDFGGYLTRDEYNNMKNTAHAVPLMPPLIGLKFDWNTSFKEEGGGAQPRGGGASEPVALSTEKLKSAASNLRLKRSKPLKNNFVSIEKTMGVTKSTASAEP